MRRLNLRALWLPRSNRVPLVGGGVLLMLAIISLAAPLLPFPDPLQQGGGPFAPPSFVHFLGTDELGRDLWSRIMHGYRVTLLAALTASIGASALGVLLGLISGYFGGWVDAAIMRLLDVLLSIPAMLLAIVFVAILGGGMVPLVIAIMLIALPPFARLTRGSVLSVKEREYVTAQRAAGASTTDIMFRTILPNVAGPAGVQLVITASIAVLTESGLSFLGLGVPPPQPTLGGMLAAANTYLYQAPQYSLTLGLAISVLVASFDAVGSGLQRRLGVASGRGGMVA